MHWHGRQGAWKPPSCPGPSRPASCGPCCPTCCRAASRPLNCWAEIRRRTSTALCWQPSIRSSGWVRPPRGARARACAPERQDLYAEHLAPWIGGANAKDSPPAPETEAAWAEQLPRLKSLFDQALSAYRGALMAHRALDFDDLEAGALALLETAEVGDRWRARLQAVLVDEFQDTNQRQRRIIDAPAGEA